MHKDQLNLTVAHYGLKKAVRFYKVIDWINQIGRIVACVVFSRLPWSVLVLASLSHTDP